MKLLFSLLCGLLFSSCNRAPSTGKTSSKGTPKYTKSITLTYVVPSGVDGSPGHQAYLFGSNWSSSRDEIIREMTRTGWTLSANYKSTDPRITFHNNSPESISGPVRGIRWEKD